MDSVTHSGVRAKEQYGMSKKFTWEEARKEIQRRRERALQHGGLEAVARHRKSGRRTIRERIDEFADDGSFVEIGTLATHSRRDGEGNIVEVTPYGYVMGLAKVDGRSVALGGQDFTVQGGSDTLSLSRSKGGMGGFVEQMAHEYRIPLILFVEGAGGGVEHDEARPPEVGGQDQSSFQLLGEVPVAAAAMGPCAGFAAGRVVISHFSVMTRETACLFAGGPPLVERALGMKINKFELGGAQIHTRRSGLVDNVAVDEVDALNQLKRFLGYMPQNVWEMPPFQPTDDPPDRRDEILLKLIPEDRRRSYDIHEVIGIILDRDSFFEISPDWGKCLVAGLGRLGGFPVGILASNPLHLGGALDAAGSQKQTRFIELCDTFHIPLIYLADVPGFMIGPAAEEEGTLRKGMRAMQAMSEATVPVISVHMRKGYGMAYDTTFNPHRLHLRLMWPTAETGSLPVEGGVAAGFRREIESAPDPKARRAEIEARLLEESSPWTLAESFALEEMVDPTETRGYIYHFIEAVQGAIKANLGPKPRYGPRI